MSGSFTPCLVDPTKAQTWMTPSLDMATFDQDTFHDAIADASQAVIDVMGWDPTSQTVTELYDGLGRSEMFVNRTPVTSVQSITINAMTGNWPAPVYPGLSVDTTTLLIDNMKTATRIFWPCGCFPIGVKNVSITYTGGYTTFPGSIQRAVLYTLKAMWLAADVDHNATGESYAGVLSQTFWPTGPGAVPPQAIALLERGNFIKTIVAP